ncbi:hypothetical protein [Deinococcus pimensis]|nr:hypothetical protein [Deinococcus pimensis]
MQVPALLNDLQQLLVLQVLQPTRPDVTRTSRRVTRGKSGPPINA